MTDRKLYLGPRLRRLRRELGLNQSAMAAEIGVSPSYLNHLERNQRPVTAQVLLRLAEAYDVDLKSFAAEGGEGTSVAQLAEIFADPMFGALAVPRYELVEMADNAPAAAEAVSRLYAALVEMRRQPPAEGEPGERPPLTPQAWVRDHIQEQRNHFPFIEDAAETLSGALGDPLTIAEPLRRRLKEGFGIDVRIVPPELLDGQSQHYDLHRKRLMLSALLRPESRTFALAYQLALVELRPVLEGMLHAAAPPDEPTRRLLHMSLANYAAAALIMPYAPFLQAAEAHRYDLHRLCAQFGASIEQVAHRLTTLNRQSARGIPFFMLRVDAAGNISKRFAGESFPFSRFGGTCPRWNLHSAFQTPGRVVTQIVETPNEQRFFTVALTVERSVRLDRREDSQLAIGLGCDVRHAGRIAYSDGLDLASPQVTPIGPACLICPRVRCPQRAAAPVGRTLSVNETRKTISPFPFIG
ncbi:MAG TPA: short-chain fatty acyl-CoA regulator family protein [Allosphingosinicella sp.]|nr:short-chain fatty acyl-CoA regulator family protein [Allosphingosinicella sp.]